MVLPAPGGAMTMALIWLANACFMSGKTSFMGRLFMAKGVNHAPPFAKENCGDGVPRCLKNKIGIMCNQRQSLRNRSELIMAHQLALGQAAFEHFANGGDKGRAAG